MRALPIKINAVFSSRSASVSNCLARARRLHELPANEILFAFVNIRYFFNDFRVYIPPRETGRENSARDSKRDEGSKRTRAAPSREQMNFPVGVTFLLN